MVFKFKNANLFQNSYHVCALGAKKKARKRCKYAQSPHTLSMHKCRMCKQCAETIAVNKK